MTSFLIWKSLLIFSMTGNKGLVDSEGTIRLVDAERLTDAKRPTDV